MKKPLFILCMGVVLWSCSKNDDNKMAAKTNADMIVGTWYIYRAYGLSRDKDGNVLDTIYDEYFDRNNISSKAELLADGKNLSWQFYSTTHKVDTSYYKIVGDSVYGSNYPLPTNPHQSQDVQVSHIDKLSSSELITSDTGLAEVYSLEVQISRR